MAEVYYTVKEVARIFRLKKLSTVRHWIVSGRFPGARRVKDGWRIPESGMVRLVERSHYLKKVRPRPRGDGEIFDEVACVEVTLVREACIYFLLNAQKRVLYIGQSVNALTRIAVHVRRIPDVATVYVRVCLENQLTQLEDQYIRKYLPPYNEAFPIGGGRIHG